MPRLFMTAKRISHPDDHNEFSLPYNLVSLNSNNGWMGGREETSDDGETDFIKGGKIAQSPLPSSNLLLNASTIPIPTAGSSTYELAGYTSNSYNNGRGLVRMRPLMTAEQRADVLASKAASVEKQKALLGMLSQHRDHLQERNENAGVDIADPTSAKRIIRRKQIL